MGLTFHNFCERGDVPQTHKDVRVSPHDGYTHVHVRVHKIRTGIL